MITSYDSYLFDEGTHYEIYRKLGAHPCEENGYIGTHFAVWAPHARNVQLITWAGHKDVRTITMAPTIGGIWEIFMPGAAKGDCYKFAVTGQDGIVRYKADPYAFFSELRPQTGSVIWPLDGYEWGDGEYMDGRGKDVPKKPMAVYEVHLGSWKRKWDGDGFLNYRQLADELAEYVTFMGFTHVELMGICEYPFDGSWGYQVTGYFSPTSRYGDPDDLRYLVDRLHRSGIGVILDWVPAHFPKDSFSLEHFDGSPLYESADPLLAEYPEWGTMAFDHSKPQVRSFLISSAFYWIREFHVDALRVDAVAAMLYTNFSRDPWRPNKYGGSENLDSIAFLKQLNEALRTQTDAYMIAEDSSEVQGITAPVPDGGLGFMFKWNMGWMNDTLKYFGKDPLFRGYHHGQLAHTADYVFTERFMLVLSHDEVVHLKKSMLMKMPGSMEDKLGGLKSLYTFMFTFPGKKLLFMGQEFAQETEWSEEREIEWNQAQETWHRAVMESVRSLLALYRSQPCLYDDTGNPTSFEWVNRDDGMRSTISYIRRNPWNYNDALLVICNFAPVGYGDYACGVPVPGYYKRVFSSYDSMPGGGGPAEAGDIVPLTAEEAPCDHYGYTLRYGLRPYEAAVFSFPVAPEETPKPRGGKASPAKKGAGGKPSAGTGGKKPSAGKNRSRNK